MHVMIRDIDDRTVLLEAEIRDLDDLNGWQLEVYAGMCNLFRREPGGVETRVTPRELKRYID